MPAPTPTPEPAPTPTAEPSNAGWDARAGIDALLDADADGKRQDLVLYGIETGLVAATVRWSEEGSGSGLAVVVIDKAGKREDIEVTTPVTAEADVPAAVAKAKKALLDKLDRGPVLRIPGREWLAIGPGKATAPLALPDLQLTLAFAKRKISVSDPAGKVIASADPGADAEKPHQPQTRMVYAMAGVPVVVVDVLFDPAGGYGEGFNVYSSPYVLALGEHKLRVGPGTAVDYTFAVGPTTPRAPVPRVVLAGGQAAKATVTHVDGGLGEIDVKVIDSAEHSPEMRSPLQLSSDTFQCAEVGCSLAITIPAAPDERALVFRVRSGADARLRIQVTSP